VVVSGVGVPVGGSAWVDGLRLEVRDWVGPTRWRWLLTGSGGEFLADHEVDLDGEGGGSESAWEGFTDLGWHLRWRASVDRRLEHEAELLADVGDWITGRALGPSVVEELAAHPGPVHLVMPPEAQVLAYRPWQAARVHGRVLAASKVTFVTDPFGRPVVVKRPVGDRLRMLAVFSLPDGTGALNLRRERYVLARLVEEIATRNDRAVELRVLQYGATRRRLEDALLEAEGWDILHVSGHGLPAGLVLEDDQGRRDEIPTDELVDVIDAGADRLKLITLSACESASLTAEDHLRTLGLNPTPPDPADQVDQVEEHIAGTERLSVLATGLVDRLDVAVLAMRYPVVDDFAIGLSGKFYDLVLGKGQPVDRALGLALPRVLPAAPTAGVPALSVATPALFGARGLGLRLQAPRGKPAVFDDERLNLARFPGQPERFVGRVAAMTRAATALAPRSGAAGVVFHGMAGAGKTACALELAYTHQDAFQRLVWHQAPLQDQDIAAAFTNVAQDLEAQLPGLKLLHLVDDVSALTGFLPTLTQFLEKTRVLLVLDNVESLLTSSGEWRDERWRLLLDAITVPSGLSRVIVTSRINPGGLPAGLRVEPVHGLSLQESVLLAREWPHLRALLDTPGSGRDDARSARGLAVRVLTMVQGHPKLIELADGQAADPAALAARLDEVDQTWLTRGIRLQDFLDTGESQARDQDYYQVLDTWTRGATAYLPEASAALFTLLTGLEDTDRLPFVLDEIWPVVWRKLGHPDPAPPIAATIGSLIEQALVAADTNPDTGEVVAYRIHPGIAEATRARTPGDTATLIDTTAAEFWKTALGSGLQGEAQGMGWLIRHAARSAAPYLARHSEWATLDIVLTQVLMRDQSPVTAAALLPFLHAAAEATTGTDLEINCAFTYARALHRLRPADAEIRLRRLLDLARDRDDYRSGSVVASELISLYREAARLDEALTLVDQMREDSRRAGYGPWTQLVDEAHRLQILMLQGHSRQVLDAVDELRDRMATLPDPSDQPETIDPWNVREVILDVGRAAARDLGLWQRSLDLNAEKMAAQEARGAAHRQLASSLFNDYGPLRSLGRLAEARALLLSCRDVFETDHDLTSLGKTLSALADIENQLGHGQTAIDLERDALRLSYPTGDVDAMAVSHHNLAAHLSRYTQQTTDAWAHLLASVVVAYQTNSGRQHGWIEATALWLGRPGPPPPSSFDQVCAIVDQTTGVHLGDLVARLPRRAPDGQAAMTEILTLAEQVDPGRYLRTWERVMSALVATVTERPSEPAAESGTAIGDDVRQAAAALLGQALDHSAGRGDWAALVTALRRVQAGERDPATLTQGLGHIETAILTRTLAAVEGSDPIDPMLWATPSRSDGEDSGDNGSGIQDLLAVVAAAANGNQEAAAAVGSVLDQMTADPDSAALAAALRAIVAGERDGPRLTSGLDTDGQAVIFAVLAALTPGINEHDTDATGKSDDEDAPRPGTSDTGAADETPVDTVKPPTPGGDTRDD
jgi:hypothetical protein